MRRITVRKSGDTAKTCEIRVPRGYRYAFTIHGRRNTASKVKGRPYVIGPEIVEITFAKIKQQDQ